MTPPNAELSEDEDEDEDGEEDAGEDCERDGREYAEGDILPNGKKKRFPKCARCLNHGKISEKKGKHLICTRLE